MWNKPSKQELSKIPTLYASEDIPVREKVIYMHFFIGASDWYVSEFSQQDQLFFGFVVLNNDYDCAEWGYFSLQELSDIKVGFVEIDRDLHFTPKQAKEIEKIRKAQGW